MKNSGMGSLGKQGGWIQLVAAGVGLAANLWGASQSKGASEAAGKENAKLIGLETKEQVRRMERTQAFRMGEAKAKIAAGGIRETGTAENVLSSLETEYRTQLGQVKAVGAQRQQAAIKSGQYVGAGRMTQTVAGGIASLASAYGSEYGSSAGGG